MIEGWRVNRDGCGVDDLSYCGAVEVTVPAGTAWDDFVAAAVDAGWVGVECLSGLPGTVGEAVAANRTAYGQAVADTVASVRTVDDEGRQHTVACADCGFGEGTSRFAGDPDSIASVDFLMRQGDLTRPVTDAALVALLGIAPGERVALTRVRAALLVDLSR